MIDGSIFRSILCKKYIQLKEQIDNEYNYIHYRYEHDFTNYFNCTIESLDKLLQTIPFKNICSN